jgi:flagellar biosynthetic protein FliR
MEILLDPRDLAGLVLAVTRTGAVAVSSPVLRAFPVPGRMAFSLGVGLALARPALDAPTLGGLVAAVAVNAGVGLVLGWLTGIVLAAFEVAGSLVDLTSGLNAGVLFNPLTGEQNSVFGRGFSLTAFTLWLVLGGDRLTVEAVGATVATIPLDGTITLAPGLAAMAVRLVSTMLAAAVQVAAPALAGLFVAEVVFGVAARFAPQANVFAIGLSAKLVAALATVGLVFAAFPEAVSASLDSTRGLVVDTIRGLGG